jgi:hypothetical protein
MIFERADFISSVSYSVFGRLFRASSVSTLGPNRTTARRAASLLLSLIVVTLAIACSADITRASSILYGNFPVPGSGITFNGVTESSGTDAVPLYGPPHTFHVGLDFDPTSFVATASGGGADITDGQLNFSVLSAPGIGIDSLSLSERGDYTLAGSGTVASQTIAGAILTAKIVDVDGVPLGTPLVLNNTASVGFNLVANAGIVQPWALGLNSLVSSFLTAHAIPYKIGATRIDVTVNNQLLAFSEPGTIAFIAKKDFVIGVTPHVPEPSTLALASLAAAGGGLARRCRLVRSQG